MNAACHGCAGSAMAGCDAAISARNGFDEISGIADRIEQLMSDRLHGGIARNRSISATPRGAKRASSTESIQVASLTVPQYSMLSNWKKP